MLGIWIGAGIAGVVGVICMILGCLIWKHENLSLFHDYHTDKIPHENKKAFCRLSGIAVIIIGIHLLAAAVIFGITASAAGFLLFVFGVILGLILLTAAFRRYR